VKVFVVDNGGQWTHREWRVLRYLGVETKIVPNTTPLEELEVDGLILSGGAPRVGLDAGMMGNNDEYLEKAEFPILGICAGHQFMAIHFGGGAGPSGIPEFGRTQILVDEEDEIFDGLPRAFQGWESHNDEVTELPEDFVQLAHSKNCKCQAMKYLKRPLYGVQFHPEVEHTDYGNDIFKNFLKVCEEYR
jgi:GMP synthase (glutamine-hydrolysing)